MSPMTETTTATSHRPDRMRRKLVGWTLAALGLLVLFPAPSRAQSWTLLDALGYGVAGGGLGLAATWDAQCSGFVCGQTIALTAGGLVGGAMAGWTIGRRADELVRSDRPLSGRHRGAVAVGTVLAGASMGGVASFLLINGEREGTFLGSDEQTLALLSLTGGGLGALLVGSRWDELTGTRLEVAPAAFDGGRPGVVARLRF